MKKQNAVFLLPLILVASGANEAQAMSRAKLPDLPATRDVVNQSVSYDEVYPMYAELCGLTQYRRRNADPGGLGGHAVLYLKGVCRDRSASIPKLRMCADELDLTDPDSGTGISVNKIFSNVNWVAIEGKDFFFHGGLQEGEVLTEERFQQSLDKAVELEIFKGIEVHPHEVSHELASKADLTEEESRQLQRLIADNAAGTDFLIKYTRNIYCTKIPMQETQMERAVAYLNHLNHHYASEEEIYTWSGFSDNCTHTAENALAAAGLMNFKKTDRFPLRQIFNLAVPSNAFVNAAEDGNDEDLHVARLYLNGRERRNILEGRNAYPRHGILLEHIPIHPQNEIFETESDFIVLSLPVVGNKRKKMRQMLETARYLELESNLRHFVAKYEKALRNLEPVEVTLERYPTFRPAEFAVFHDAYRQYVTAQLDEARTLLGQVVALKAAR